MYQQLYSFRRSSDIIKDVQNKFYLAYQITYCEQQHILIFLIA